MKVLVLSCSTGEGHNSAAHAIAEALERRNIEYTLTDPLKFRSEKTARFVASAYNGIIRKTPKVFGAIYRAGVVYSASKLPSPIYQANALYAERLCTYLTDNKFDAVITTHLFAMEALTAIRKKHGSCIPCFGVMTDYTCIPFVHETLLDGYSIPHEDLRNSIERLGMSPEKLYSMGIPVSHRFSNRLTKDEARSKLCLPKTIPMTLIMTGGVGCGKISELCSKFLERTNDDLLICVLTGRNTELKLKLDEEFGGTGKVLTVPFTQDVNLYMNAADVMVSKPGGLSSTEAAVANVPLVHLLAFSGCETKNAEFFAAHNMSYHAESIDSAVKASWELIHDRVSAEKMCASQRANVHDHSADEIVEKVVSLCSRKSC